MDEQYRPFGVPDADPLPPPFPERVRNVIYAFAIRAQQDEAAKVGAGRHNPPPDTGLPLP